MQTCALIPAFNEAPHIAKVIAGVRRRNGGCGPDRWSDLPGVENQ
jgi:hypothetical protein